MKKKINMYYQCLRNLMASLMTSSDPKSQYQKMKPTPHMFGQVYGTFEYLEQPEGVMVFVHQGMSGVKAEQFTEM